LDSSYEVFVEVFIDNNFLTKRTGQQRFVSERMRNYFTDGLNIQNFFKNKIKFLREGFFQQTWERISDKSYIIPIKKVGDNSAVKLYIFRQISGHPNDIIEAISYQQKDIDDSIIFRMNKFPFSHQLAPQNLVLEGCKTSEGFFLILNQLYGFGENSKAFQRYNFVLSNFLKIDFDNELSKAKFSKDNTPLFTQVEISFLKMIHLKFMKSFTKNAPTDWLDDDGKYSEALWNYRNAYVVSDLYRKITEQNPANTLNYLEYLWLMTPESNRIEYFREAIGIDLDEMVKDESGNLVHTVRYDNGHFIFTKYFDTRGLFCPENKLWEYWNIRYRKELSELGNEHLNGQLEHDLELLRQIWRKYAPQEDVDYMECWVRYMCDHEIDSKNPLWEDLLIDSIINQESGFFWSHAWRNYWNDFNIRRP
jgi:hypothetical protein